MKNNKKNFTKAKKSQCKKDWIEYRRNKNIISDMVNKDNTQRIEKLLEDPKERWGILKKICNKEEFETPKEIKTKEGVERKPGKLDNLANNHHIKKIKKSMEEKPKSLDEVDPKLLATYEKLGIPLKEQMILAGVEGAEDAPSEGRKVAVDAVFDSVSVGTTFQEELKKAGVIIWTRYITRTQAGGSVNLLVPTSAAWS